MLSWVSRYHHSELLASYCTTGKATDFHSDAKDDNGEESTYTSMGGAIDQAASDKAEDSCKEYSGSDIRDVEPDIAFARQYIISCRPDTRVWNKGIMA